MVIALAKDPQPPLMTPMRISDQVYTALKQAIIVLEFLPDALLLEDDLARRYGVSKTPVRDALAKLEREGFVVATPHKETRVASLSLEDLWEMYVTKNALEGYCVRRLAGALSGGQVAQLRATLARCEAALAADDYRWWIRETSAYHRIYVEIFGNKRFLSILTNLQDHMQRARGLFISRHNSENLAVMHRYHTAVYEAVVTGDGARAEELLHEHNEIFFRMLRADSALSAANQTGGNQA